VVIALHCRVDLVMIIRRAAVEVRNCRTTQIATTAWQVAVAATMQETGSAAGGSSGDMELWIPLAFHNAAVLEMWL